MDIVVLGIDLGKKLVQPGGFGCVRPGYFCAVECGGSSVESFVKGLGALHRSDGSMLRRASSWGACSLPMGTKTRLMSPEYVRPYVKAQKNDELDAGGDSRRRRLGRRCGSLR